jgi:ubiquitin carboxyl-terminal hydrolase 10
MYGPPPQSPINPYAFHHGPPPPFYPQQQFQQYPRWQQYPHQQYNPYTHVPPNMPQQHVPAYPPRSPLVVSSQPVGTTPRQAPSYPQQHAPVAANSPRPVPQHMSSYTHNLNGLPSPAPTPPKREETPSEQVQQAPPREDTQSVSMSDTASAPSRRQSTVTNVLSLQPETRTPYYPTVSKLVPASYRTSY